MNLPVFSLLGLGVSKGYAFGNAVILGSSGREVSHYYIRPEDRGAECHRLSQSIMVVANEISVQIQDLSNDLANEVEAILHAHLLIVQDTELYNQACHIIMSKGYNAEWALSTYMQTVSEVFAIMDDNYIRERIDDIRHVIQRVIDTLQGTVNNAKDFDISSSEQQDLIIVSHDISPAEMLSLRKRQFVGFCTDLGTPTSHTAIVARSIGVPATVALNTASQCIKDGDFLILDGFKGIVLVNPSQEMINSYQAAAVDYRNTLMSRSKIIHQDIYNAQGDKIDLFVNLDILEELSSIKSSFSAGIGLFRTEFLFMNRADIPSEEEQFSIYKNLVESMDGKEVTIRTLDIGADKTLDHHIGQSTNPALGLRAIRYCLSKPGLFITQLRALIRASAYGTLRILIPMITNVQEVIEVRKLIQLIKEELQHQEISYSDRIMLGIMVEVPACALTLQEYLPLIDFISIGTNDLIQYTLAIDRQDQEVSYLYDPMHPAILHLLKYCISVAKTANIPVCVCGEVASDPNYVKVLLDLGLTQFSVPPHSLLEIKEKILELQ